MTQFNKTWRKPPNEVKNNTEHKGFKRLGIIWRCNYGDGGIVGTISFRILAAILKRMQKNKNSHVAASKAGTLLKR
jgi:hypothetical protein